MSSSRSATPSFVIVEADGFGSAEVLNVLQGHVACTIIREFAASEDCARAFQSFAGSSMTRRREGDATGFYLGSYHWQRQRDEYLRDSTTVFDAVHAVAETESNLLWGRFLQLLSTALLSDGQKLRAAQWAGQEVATPLIRSWAGVGEFSLVPHEDAAQCMDPAQADYEIQRCVESTVASANLCLVNEGGGQLVLWNHIPSSAERNRFGTAYTGGPYPAEWLSGFERLEVVIRPGDLYVFNGSLLHAVSSTVGRRATISCLLGYINEVEIVMWT